jgi:hypothetical protein
MSDIEVPDPLGLAAALACIPEAAALDSVPFRSLHDRALHRLITRLAARMTADLDENQLAEYAAAADYQHTHPGTGEHTRAWMAANLPARHDLLAQETRRLVDETTWALRHGNP